MTFMTESKIKNNNLLTLIQVEVLKNIKMKIMKNHLSKISEEIIINKILKINLDLKNNKQ